MANPDICLDHYNESLKVGDYVIPIYKEALELGVSGYISSILYSKQNYAHYITIVDEKGNVLLKDVCSSYYTTRERQNIRDNRKYVYILTCYNSKFQRFFYLPLTNNTDINFIIPNETCYITLDAIHLEEKGRENKHETILTCYYQLSLYFYLLKDKVEISHNRDNNHTYIFNNEAMFPLKISKNYITFDEIEALQKYIRNLIKYFNDADLTNIHNEKEFKRNKSKEEFENQLLLKLKKHD